MLSFQVGHQILSLASLPMRKKPTNTLFRLLRLLKRVRNLDIVIGGIDALRNIVAEAGKVRYGEGGWGIEEHAASGQEDDAVEHVEYAPGGLMDRCERDEISLEGVRGWIQR